MQFANSETRSLRSLFLILIFALFSLALPLGAQTDSLVEMNRKANDLLKQGKYTEALPILEKLVIAEPGDSGHQFFLGFSLNAKAANTQDAAERQALRV